MKKLNVMKSAVTIIFLLLIVHCLNYIYKKYLKLEYSELHDLDFKSDLKLQKMLKTTFEKISKFH
jgi:hypothetical protein